ncbi:hypothetical protein [Enterobacter kobei]|uniref:hypothetical protein n=1 Tax=Enterobacter kobei TaxID=208224 RepID=UPI0018A5012B|nr:hypothetical protein [Enterobacter kobei]BBV85990.1 hypothetical protein STW0522ENT62_14360 [Enterobacter kobei]
MKILKQVAAMSVLTAAATVLIHYGTLDGVIRNGLGAFVSFVLYYLYSLIVGQVAMAFKPLVTVAIKAINITGRTRLVMPVCVLFWMFYAALVALVVLCVTQLLTGIQYYTHCEFLIIVMIAGVASRRTETLYKHWQ